MSKDSIITTLGEAFPLNELMSRFHEVWLQHRDSTEGPVTRIASFNLLVVTTGNNEAELESILEGLKESHPARLIWLSIDRDKSWEDSTAQIHLGCRCEREQVCSEQILIQCGDSPQRVASMILPLIRACLPTHLLWWEAGPLNGTLFERLADRAKLILFKNEQWKDTLQQLPALWTDPEKMEHTYYPLAWFRILKIRQNIAWSFARGNVKLTLSQNRPEESYLLRTWLDSLLRHNGDTYQWNDTTIEVLNGDHMSLTVMNEEKPLEPEESLYAVRQALDRPNRDRVFQKIVSRLKGASHEKN